MNRQTVQTLRTLKSLVEEEQISLIESFGIRYLGRAGEIENLLDDVYNGNVLRIQVHGNDLQLVQTVLLSVVAADIVGSPSVIIRDNNLQRLARVAQHFGIRMADIKIMAPLVTEIEKKFDLD